MKFPWEQILTMVVAIFGSTGFWTWLMHKQDEKNAKKTDLTLMSDALLAIIHDRMYYLCKKTISEGNITPEDYENLNKMYIPYQKLGGNGTVHKMMNEISNMSFGKAGVV